MTIAKEDHISFNGIKEQESMYSKNVHPVLSLMI
jgi:hypothetical protein